MYYNMCHLTLQRRSRQEMNKTQSSTSPTFATSHLLRIQSARARELLILRKLGSERNTFERCHQYGRLETDGVATS
jgi:hypothetical protein